MTGDCYWVKDVSCELHHQTGDWSKESNARKTQAFVLEGKTYRVCHLQSTLQIFQNTYSSFAHLIIWVVWFLFILNCISLIYTWIRSPYKICDLQIFFLFHRLSFHFMDGFFYYAECFEFNVVSLVYFCSSCLCFWWLSCLSCLYFGKQSFISCFICYYLLQFLPKDTDWLNGYKNKTHIYAVYKRPTSVLDTHTDWKWVDGKRYSMQMEIKRKPDWQFSYQKK